MKKTVLSALLGLCFVGAAYSADMTIYYSPTCPHCHHAKDFTNNNFIYEYPTITVTTVDVTVPEHRTLFIDVLKACDYSSGGVPVIKIGDKCFQGFGEGMADELRAAIEVDLSADAKKSAAEVKKAIAANGDKYRNEHPTPVATVTEYVLPTEATTDESEKKTDESDNNLVLWGLGVLALLVVWGIARKKARK